MLTGMVVLYGAVKWTGQRAPVRPVHPLQNGIK